MRSLLEKISYNDGEFPRRELEEMNLVGACHFSILEITNQYLNDDKSFNIRDFR
jgi:hypothetical protein